MRPVRVCSFVVHASHGVLPRPTDSDFWQAFRIDDCDRLCAAGIARRLYSRAVLSGLAFERSNFRSVSLPTRINRVSLARSGVGDGDRSSPPADVGSFCRSALSRGGDLTAKTKKEKKNVRFRFAAPPAPSVRQSSSRRSFAFEPVGGLAHREIGNFPVGPRMSWAPSRDPVGHCNLQIGLKHESTLEKWLKVLCYLVSIEEL